MTLDDSVPTVDVPMGLVYGSIVRTPMKNVMNIKGRKIKHIESALSLPRLGGHLLRLDQQRVLELEDGDSFLLQTIPISESECMVLRWRFYSASHFATRLANWARGRHIRLAYRMVDKTTVRIWRLGAI